MKKRRRRNLRGADDGEFAQGGIVDGAVPEEGAGAVQGTLLRTKEAFSRLRSFADENRATLTGTALPTVYCLIFGSVEAFMGIYPFSVSAICATISGGGLLFATVAAVVASLLVRGGAYISFSSVLAAGLLYLIKKLRGEEASKSTTLRAAVSLVAGATQTALFFIREGVGFYGLCAVLLSAVICPLLTVSLKGLFFGKGRMSHGAEMGIYALIFTALYFLRSLSPMGGSVALVLGVTAVLFCSYLYGMEKSIMVALAAGLAFSAEYSFIFAAIAAGAGILMGITPVGAAIGGVFLGLAFGIYSGKAYAFGDLFPELMLSLSVTVPIFRYRIISPKAAASEAEPLAEEITTVRLSQTKRRLRAVSESMSMISGVMKKLAGAAARPSLTETGQLCDRAFDESCRECEGRRLCWDREYRETSGAVNAMAEAVRRGKRIDGGYLTEGIRQRCEYKEQILSRINDCGQSLGGEGNHGPEEQLSVDYGMMAELIGHIAEGADEDTEYDEKYSSALKERFERMGIRPKKLMVYGKRRRRVLAFGIEKGCPAGNEEIRAAAADILGCEMTSPEYRIDGPRITMELHTTEKLSVRVGKASVAKRGERCGDSVAHFRGEGGYFYTLISDGMGSGSEASLTSGVSTVFLEKMLSAGAPLTSSLELLNSFLERREGECFTTVDLMEADLVTGELRFVKSGAAPSFVLREGRLFRISSKTVPVGIITPFDAERVTFSARAGDIVIMLSDGAFSEGEDSPWLYDILMGEGGALSGVEDPDAVARRIAEAAAGERGYSDDVTVGIVEIGKAGELGRG